MSRRKKEEGRRKKEEGRRKKEEGRGNFFPILPLSPLSHSPPSLTLPLSPSPTLPLPPIPKNTPSSAGADNPWDLAILWQFHPHSSNCCPWRFQRS
ncbi:MAG: hypothetical protein MUE44_19245 [Oscillatoriaceae cyanobacterium Prado104]|nr:hypothetical protein [Oscillatoriaceae cyanobacterium Prado104]